MICDSILPLFFSKIRHQGWRITTTCTEAEGLMDQKTIILDNNLQLEKLTKSRNNLHHLIIIFLKKMLGRILKFSETFYDRQFMFTMGTVEDNTIKFKTNHHWKSSTPYLKTKKKKKEGKKEGGKLNAYTKFQVFNKKRKKKKEEKANITQTNPQRKITTRVAEILMKRSINDKHKTDGEDEPTDKAWQSKHKRNNFKANIGTRSWHLKHKKEKKNDFGTKESPRIIGGEKEREKERKRHIHTSKSVGIIRVRVRVRMMKRKP